MELPELKKGEGASTEVLNLTDRPEGGKIPGENPMKLFVYYGQVLF